jgi:hypothetical protein
MNYCYFDNPDTFRRHCYYNKNELSSLCAEVILSKIGLSRHFGEKWHHDWRSGQVTGDMQSLPDHLRPFVIEYPKPVEQTIT